MRRSALLASTARAFFSLPQPAGHKLPTDGMPAPVASNTPTRKHETQEEREHRKRRALAVRK